MGKSAVSEAGWPGTTWEEHRRTDTSVPLSGAAGGGRRHRFLVVFYYSNWKFSFRLKLHSWEHLFQKFLESIFILFIRHREIWYPQVDSPNGDKNQVKVRSEEVGLHCPYRSQGLWYSDSPRCALEGRYIWVTVAGTQRRQFDLGHRHLPTPSPVQCISTQDSIPA